MTVLFGTVEYFEREIQQFLQESNSTEYSEQHVLVIKEKLEHELRFDFVCDEPLREECLRNLDYASELVAV